METKIPLSRGLVAIIDECDSEQAKYNWYARESKGPGSGYLYAGRWVRDKQGKRNIVWLHREILNPSSNEFVDHIDGNGLNNRRSNLRLCNRSQNAVNSKRNSGSSKFRGVVWHKASSRWLAQIGFQKRKIHLGLFDSEEEASAAYRAKERELYGDFVREEA